MKPRYRHAELLSNDAKLRLAIYDRADHRFQIVEERVRSYEAGDEWHPDYVPFPNGAEWEPFWQIDQQARDGLFGTVDDALVEAKLVLANGRSPPDRDIQLAHPPPLPNSPPMDFRPPRP